jgi:hypothetical protein
LRIKRAVKMEIPIKKNVPADSPRSGAHEWILPVSFWALIAIFYFVTFLLKASPLQTAIFGFLAIGVCVGLLETASAPTPISSPILSDTVLAAVAALMVQVAVRSGSMNAIQAAALMGVVAWLAGKSGAMQAAPMYCGAFAGMTSSLVLPSLSWVTFAGALSGAFYSLANHHWGGVGGKLGTLAFAGSAITTAAAHAAGAAGKGTSIGPMEPTMQIMVLLVSVCAVPITYWLAEHRGLGAILASAMPSALLAFGLSLLSAPGQFKMIPVATAWFGASFGGMTSSDRLAGRHWTLPLMGLIYGFLSLGFGPHLAGIGGGLGTTAAVSVLAAFGIGRAWRDGGGRAAQPPMVGL